ncbi:hypothetical protein CC80DRAFT_503624 [Byssothecium circinans]|uniref:Uncharacterized protein n=1 Tax=Byssothecium circinans TaxID=147558 RepID=A0A6A5TX94_9PLEO|nr:hypothetical protein CC80DRAFT_503624 [Byssothecium circinans]
MASASDEPLNATLPPLRRTRTSTLSISMLSLEIFFDFERNEIMIRFETKEHAKSYQAKNPEGRILSDVPCEVWIPKDPRIKALYNGSSGMVFIFHNSMDRAIWRNRVLLARDWASPDGICGVEFRTLWTHREFSESLNMTETPDDRNQRPRQRAYDSSPALFDFTPSAPSDPQDVPQVANAPNIEERPPSTLAMVPRPSHIRYERMRPLPSP